MHYFVVVCFVCTNYCKMNPNYLLRDELVYELGIRGINVEVHLFYGVNTMLN